jgi:carbon monoxide dehydrogenase subunit G
LSLAFCTAPICPRPEVFTNLSIVSRRNGPELEIKGKFTIGTIVGAEEVQVGLPTGLAVSSSITISPVGLWINGTTAIGNTTDILATGADTYFNVSTSETGGGLSPCTASSLLNSGDVIGVFASIPIEGWEV